MNFKYDESKLFSCPFKNHRLQHKIQTLGKASSGGKCAGVKNDHHLSSLTKGYF